MRRPPKRPLMLALLLALLALPQAARAHRVYLFAWDEGGRVCSRSYYSKTAQVADAELTVRDAEGKELLRGRSDQDGLFCFARPHGGELLLAVNAGQGHRGEFRLSARSPAGGDQTDPERVEPARLAPAPPAALAVDQESLRRIVREELTRIASGREETPGLRDILGGLGWIAGLAALFAWYRKRRAS